jgi:lipopolysaccharide export system protein LptC
MGWTVPRRTNIERAFRGARRHSFLVRVLRVGVPLGAVTLVVGLSLAAWLNPLRSVAKLPGAAGNLVVSGTKITMELPRLAGFTKDSRAYELSAHSAAQDLLDRDKVELKDIKAKVEMQDKSVVTMSAAAGLYNTKAEQLTLTEEIVLTSSAGHSGHLTEAVVDTKSGNIVSDKPVELKFVGGQLNANRMEIIESGDLLRFERGVTLVIDQRDKPANERANTQ